MRGGEIVLKTCAPVPSMESLVILVIVQNGLVDKQIPHGSPYRYNALPNPGGQNKKKLQNSRKAVVHIQRELETEETKNSAQKSWRW